MSITEKTKLTAGSDEVNIHWCCNRSAEKSDIAQQSEEPERIHLAPAPARQLLGINVRVRAKA